MQIGCHPDKKKELYADKKTVGKVAGGGGGVDKNVTRIADMARMAKRRKWKCSGHKGEEVTDGYSKPLKGTKNKTRF